MLSAKFTMGLCCPAGEGRKYGTQCIMPWRNRLIPPMDEWWAILKGPSEQSSRLNGIVKCGGWWCQRPNGTDSVWYKTVVENVVNVPFSRLVMISFLFVFASFFKKNFPRLSAFRAMFPSQQPQCKSGRHFAYYDTPELACFCRVARTSVCIQHVGAYEATRFR